MTSNVVTTIVTTDTYGVESTYTLTLTPDSQSDELTTPVSSSSSGNFGSFSGASISTSAPITTINSPTSVIPSFEQATSTQVSSLSSTSGTPTEEATISFIILSVQLATRTAKFTSTATPIQKRQADSLVEGYVGVKDEPITALCRRAVVFQRRGGQLFRGRRPISVDPGIPSIDIANYSDGSLSTEFSVESGRLYWSNLSFFNGSAKFCSTSTGAVYALFTDAIIDDCISVNLVLIEG